MSAQRRSAWLLLLACAPLMACSRPFARVAGVTVNDQLVSGPVQGVAVVHEGEIIRRGQGTALVPGDTIRTDENTRVRLELSTGYEVYLEENTELAILNPKLLLKLGKAFIRSVRERIEDVREALRVETQYVVAAPTGTAFLLEVSPDSAVRYIVTEGRVRIEWRPQSDTVSGPPPWQPVVYGPNEGGVVRPRQPPERTPRLSDADVQRELDWVREVERLTVAVVPDLTGTSRDEAQALLQREGLEVGSITEDVQEGGRGGVVLSQTRRPGERLVPGQTVDLVVSVAGVRVPRLENARESAAVERLEDLDLIVGGITREKVRGQRAGVVIRTDPPAGRLVAAGSRVALVLTAPCTVPDLSGLTREQAAERLRREALVVGQVGFGKQGTTVSGQEPAPRTTVTCGAPVDFFIGTIRHD